MVAVKKEWALQSGYLTPNLNKGDWLNVMYDIFFLLFFKQNFLIAGA